MNALRGIGFGNGPVVSTPVQRKPPVFAGAAVAEKPVRPANTLPMGAMGRSHFAGSIAAIRFGNDKQSLEASVPVRSRSSSMASKPARPPADTS